MIYISVVLKWTVDSLSQTECPRGAQRWAWFQEIEFALWRHTMSALIQCESCSAVSSAVQTAVLCQDHTTQLRRMMARKWDNSQSAWVMGLLWDWPGCGCIQCVEMDGSWWDTAEWWESHQLTGVDWRCGQDIVTWNHNAYDRQMISSVDLRPWIKSVTHHRNQTII